MCKGGGTQTTTSTQAIDPRVWDMVNSNVNRATGIADKGFQAYNGNPYAGTGQPASPGTPGTEGYYSHGDPTYDGDGNQTGYGPDVYNPGTPGTPATPGTNPQFNPNAFVAPLTANQNTAIDGAPGLLGAGQGATNAAVGGAANLLNYRPSSIMPVTANSNTAQAAGYNASLLGGQPDVANYGADAANINRNDVRNINGGTGADGMAAYRNPYENQVVQSALSDLDTQRQRAIGGNTDAAVRAGAFGGSRQGVADSLTNEAYGKISAQTAAQLRQSGFDTAAGLGQQDASRSLQAQNANQGADLSIAGQNAGYTQGTNQFNATARNDIGLANANLQMQRGLANQSAANTASQFGANNQQQTNLANAGILNQGNQFNAGAINQAQGQNQQAGLAGAGLNQAAAGLLGTLGNQQQGMYGTALNGLLQTGGLQQQNNQSALDAAYQEFLRSQNYPFIGQNLVNQSLGLLPQGGTTTQTSPKPDNTGGLLSGIGSIASAAAMFSDGRLKDAIRFEGWDEVGRRWYTYRYNWEECGTRHFGVIAQEVMASDPQAVFEHPTLGYLMVDYSKLTRH